MLTIFSELFKPTILNPKEVIKMNTQIHIHEANYNPDNTVTIKREYYEKLVAICTEYSKIVNNITNQIKSEPQNCLEKAAEIIEGDREQTYGSADINLKNIANFWYLYLQSKGIAKGDIWITINDVCAMMRLVKEARLINTPDHEDSLVDICGYTRLQQKCQQSNKKHGAGGTIEKGGGGSIYNTETKTHS